MARFHVSQSVPTKHEAIAAWARRQDWGPDDAEIVRLGSFHFDDPEGEVGMETHLLVVDGVHHLVPATYRAAPLDGADDALIGTIEHSVLGTRWLHDGLADDRYLLLLAATALTGQGPAVGLASHRGRWWVAPSELRLEGGGWGTDPVAVDGLVVEDRDASTVVGRNDTLEVRFHRHPVAGPQPPLGLRVSAPAGEPLVAVEVRRRGE